MKKKTFLQNNDKSKCSACRACEQSCSVNAIAMKEDSDGFIYPYIDSSKCIECGACVDVCPYSNDVSTKVPEDIYSFQICDKQALSNSSSGGVFFALAKYCIDSAGVVYGCVFDDEYRAFIDRATVIDEVYPMQGSKYVSSDTRDSYRNVKSDLTNGKFVLFTGTPCQVAGLKSYLKKDYPNLLTMDFLCHGVPSHKLFDANIRYLKKKYRGNITDYRFRDKKKGGWGHRISYVVNRKFHYEISRENLYYNCFIDGLANRYSCYACAFRGGKRMSDITVGDFWGYNSTDIDSQKGVSFVQLNTDKAKNIFGKIEDTFIAFETTHKDVAAQNATLIEETVNSVPEIRQKIYSEIDNLGFEICAKKYFYPRNMWIHKIKKYIPTFAKKIIQKMR